MKIKMKKLGKNEFDFWILHIKISLYENFHENLRKKMTHFKDIFDWGKNEDENEKIWKNESHFWILHIKIKLCGKFNKNLRKKAFFKIFTWEGHIRIEVLKGTYHGAIILTRSNNS